MDNYYVWTSHGETEGSDGNIYNHNFDIGESSQDPRLYEMVMNALGMYNEGENQQYVDQAPNEEANHFYARLESASRPLSDGMSHSKLSVATRLLSIKSDASVSQTGMDSMIELMKELNPNLDIPDDYYKAKRLASKLGLSLERIDCCEKSCMLYYKDDAILENCKFRGMSRFKQLASGNKVTVKSMHYLPLIPRLKRLYASMSSAPHMRWHFENKRPPVVLCHPSDGEAWKHFDRVFPNFANEPRNIRLGLCADRFTPFSISATPYSCWPVFVTLYNLPPEMCMTSPYLFLTCIIPGTRNPKSLIDIYLQPLIHELQILWHEGVATYDISTKQNFNLRAALMWTINDFPAYGILSGWMTAGKLACPYCMKNTKAFTLKHGGKNSWFDCHRQFLPVDHEFRGMRNAFGINKQ
ncbi:uncharacterized protein LOC107762612 [Nicotiana tabacum]|uniref:Uncharacterized protein LOC107762612 n=1 Tax=Nicotiana tabacum TaxID=4097 RepID=A0A1S3X9I2_TOBAC|nr:PREDICTED: uncharacterized protein LOC107762612 [Nicotiana tabacum]